MKRLLALLLCFSISLTLLNAQSIGVSMSYLYPKNGYFASPIAPLSFQDMGVGLGDYFSLAVSLTLYNVGGMSIASLPFGESEKPLMGPFVSLAMGFYPIIKIPISEEKVNLELKGGWLGFKNFNPRLMGGNMNDLISVANSLNGVSSDWTFDNKFGSGWSFGGDFIFFVTETIGLKLGGKYLLAKGPLNLNGTYSGTDPDNVSVVITESLELPDAYLDYQGLSVNIGVVIKNK